MFMKRILVVLMILLVAAGFVSANGNADNAGETQKEVSKELTLYHSHPSSWTDPLIKEFEERTGIHVNVVGAGTGELAARIKAEKEAPQADVLWGGGAPTYQGILDLLQPYEHPYMDVVPSWSRDPQNRWHGSIMFPMVIIYNPKLVAPEDAPKTWDDLLKPEFKGRIAHADPTKSGSAFTALTIQLAVKGGDNDQGWAWQKRFVENLDGKLLGSSSGTYKGVSDGEYAVGITYEEGALRYYRSGADLEVVYPEDGTINFPIPIAVIKNCPDPESAQAFVDFILSKDVQSRMGELNNRTVRMDVELPDFMMPNNSPVFRPYSLDLLENTDGKLQRWKDLIMGK
jgi:iron(III) transport system substrate-binding protein